MSNEDREKRLKALEDFAFNIDKIVKQPAPVSEEEQSRRKADERARRRNVEEKQVDKLILELLLLHKEIVKVDERDFLDLLKHSLSLDTMEKKKVVDAVPTLSQFQFDELKKIFVQAREQFKQLTKEHPDEIKKLLQKQQTKWLQLGDLYKEEQSRRREAEVKRDEEAARQRAEARRQVAGSGRVSRTAQGVEVFRDSLRSGGEGPAMVMLPPGCFRMGDLDGSGYGERPVHTVTISRPIAMGRYPVTFEDYDFYVSATGAERPGDEGWGRGRRPVINVNWHEVKAYAAWLSEQTGKRYRLPTESEWEYAARAGTETVYSWGDEIGVNRANGLDLDSSIKWDDRQTLREAVDAAITQLDSFGSKWGGRQTSPVGSFEPNAFGLYDMHGNVCEWVEDCWHGNYEGAPSDGSAWTSGGDSSIAVVRGGSWFDGARKLRAAYRDWYSLSDRFSYVGFRLVQDLNP